MNCLWHVLFVFLHPCVWISWRLWATCRGQCWCTEWVWTILWLNHKHTFCSQQQITFLLVFSNLLWELRIKILSLLWLLSILRNNSNQDLSPVDEFILPLFLPLLTREWTRWSQICAPVPPFSLLLYPSPPLISFPTSEMNSSSSSTSTSDGRTLHTPIHVYTDRVNPVRLVSWICCWNNNSTILLSSLYQALRSKGQKARVWDPQQETKDSMRKWQILLLPFFQK